MAKDKRQNQKDDKTAMLAVALFVGAGGLVVYSLMIPDTAPPAAAKNALLHTEKYEAKVNRHLMITNEKIEMQRRRMMMENEVLAPEYFRTKPGATVSRSNEGVDLSSDPHPVEVAKDLNRDTKVPAHPQTPDELIQRELFDQQQDREYSRAYKEEYARQFIANAAKNGWRVKLNDDYKVISVTPIRNPSAADVFQGSGGGSAK